MICKAKPDVEAQALLDTGSGDAPAAGGRKMWPVVAGLMVVALCALVGVSARRHNIANLNPNLGEFVNGARKVDGPCRIVYYYHLPKTGGGSIVRHYGHQREVQMLRYESTMYVPPQNESLAYWESQDDASHWNKFIKPHALSPGNHFIAHHWGRPGMWQMKDRIATMRQQAKQQGCAFLSAITFRDPVDRDISDAMFRRLTGVNGEENYLGNEQMRFMLINSNHESKTIPRVLDKTTWPQALKNAKDILQGFDIVSTIEDIDQLSSRLDRFYGLSYEEPLEHVHKIDYSQLGVDEQELARMREKFSHRNNLDRELYRIARERSPVETAPPSRR